VKYTVEGTQLTLPLDLTSHLPLGIFSSTSHTAVLQIGYRHVTTKLSFSFSLNVVVYKESQATE
jgi:hypothetical protein